MISTKKVISDFGEIVSHAHVGDSLKVTVKSGGMTAEKYVVLSPVPGTRLVPLIGAVVMPVFCLILGFWVAVIRPRDPLAWLLLALLLGAANRYATFF
jgi:hypothetical protein